MLSVDITENVQEALRGVGDFFRDQVPFITSQALTDTAFDVRRRIVGSTWPKAVTMRNKVFPGRVFKVSQKATKAQLEAIIAGDDSFDYLGRLSDGGTKVPRGNWLAIPMDGVKRTSGGAVAKSYKPRMLKNSFVRNVKGRSDQKVILQRKGKENVVRYLLVKRAQIPATFRFYEDAEATTMRVFSGHWSTRLAAVVRASVFDAV
jgi:hypothetical protein